MLPLRETSGLPDPNISPPQIAQSGDPFARLRVAHLVARIPRGTPVRLRDIVDRLNSEYVDWSFDRRVVVETLVQLQSNWMIDFRNTSGIEFGRDAAGETVTLEDTTRVDAWMISQTERLVGACRERLRTFAVEEGAIP
ncbi:MAG TPA: hypothetical protein VFW92_04495 [Candidatus Limnocylindrales bacterium]|nr:hypothetical protein [Candidatus Limnocylindrales bacterium]